MIDKFTSAPQKRLNKVNRQLKRQFGVTINPESAKDELIAMKESISEINDSLKLRGKTSHRDPEMSKNLLMIEGLSAAIEIQEVLEESLMREQYMKIVDWLANYVYRNVVVGDDFDDAMREGMKQYRSSKYRFNDETVETDVKNTVMNKLRDTKFDGDMDQLATEETDPWTMDGSNGSSAPERPEAGYLAKIRARAAQRKLSNEQVSEMKRNYVKELRQLLESEVDQAEVLVAAKGFSSELQDIIQKIGRMQNEDLSPVVDQMRQAYGADVAQEFQQGMHSDLDGIIASLRQTKSEIDQAVDGMANGGGMMGADGGMGMEVGMDDGMGDELEMDAEMGGDMGMEPEDPALSDEMADDFGGADAAAMDDEPLGRMAKESKIAKMQAQMRSLEESIAKMKGTSAKK